MMKVCFIGSGNVATVLAKLLHSKGYNIAEVYSKDVQHANLLAEKVQAKAVDSIKEISLQSDIYIIAVADKAIAEIASHLFVVDKLVLHTAGSVSKNVLQTTSTNYGTLYPVQSIRKDMVITTPIPFMIDGNSETNILAIENLVNTLQQKFVLGNDEHRLKLHVAAVFACNFVNYMYLQSATFCEKENIDFTILQSLIEETATRLQNQHPQEVFTGPAARRDMATINKHLDLLQPYPDMYELYKKLSELIIEKANEN